MFNYDKYMTINPVTTAPTPAKRNHLPVQLTGYGALAAGVTSGILAKNKKIKAHQYWAYITGILALAHTGIIEWSHHSKNV